MAEDPDPAGTTRRELLAKSVFVTPAILTLAAVPSFASAGSTGHHHDDHDDDDDDDDYKKEKDKD